MSHCPDCQNDHLPNVCESCKDKDEAIHVMRTSLELERNLVENLRPTEARMLQMQNALGIAIQFIDDLNEGCDGDLCTNDKLHSACRETLDNIYAIEGTLGAKLITARENVLALAAPFAKYSVPHKHVCFGCDMGHAGPGPEGEHDAHCDIKKLIDALGEYNAAKAAL